MYIIFGPHNRLLWGPKTVPEHFYDIWGVRTPDLNKCNNCVPLRPMNLTTAFSLYDQLSLRWHTQDKFIKSYVKPHSNKQIEII